MKIGDFGFVKSDSERDALLERLASFNDTATDYPRDKTVHALFAEQAALRPDAVAILQDGRPVTYRELDELSNQVCRFLLERGAAPESFIAFILDRADLVLAAVLGTLKAGCAYFPIDVDTPYERMKYMIDDSRSPALFFERRSLREANRLQWDCASLDAIVCMDSGDVHAEWETTGEFMKSDVWNYVGQTAFDDISGGGWKSSYTGEWLSREVMDDYGDNIVKKLAPRLNSDMRILEIGCSSGISMFRLAPLVNHYCGTDLSAEILKWTEEERIRRGVDNISLHNLAAHELDRLPDAGFDVVIINSVLQCFSGHNYFRHVIRMALDKMNDRGLIFLGNVWDQDLKDKFTRSLIDYMQTRARPGERTIVDHSEALFINRSFLNDLRSDFNAIASIETSAMITDHVSELSDYGYDALLEVDKRASASPAPRCKQQYDARALDALSTEPVEERGKADNLAYVMYTSGTSGAPKGALIEHRSIVRLVRDANYIEIHPDDCILQTGALAFDASTFEFWGALLNGATLCRPPKHGILDAASLKDAIASSGATVMWLTSSLFNQMIDSGLKVFEGMRVVLTGGEKLSPYHVNKARRDYPDLILINGYGPTENTTFTATWRIDEPVEGDVPIGHPVSNTRVHILDLNLAPVPIGVTGEIYAGGDGVARGYLNDDELTREKFILEPALDDSRLYRTGDLGRWRNDGAIDYLGRIDDQVKIRGHRIEPLEIEAVINRMERVKEAVVLGRKNRSGEAFLAAYYTGDDELDSTRVREALKHTLPDYMIPSHFIKLDKMPLTPNGKVDRRALPEPQDEDRVRSRAYAAPQNEIEESLCRIWSEVIGGPAPGVNDDFFESGGHSLTVSKLVSRIHSKMDVVVPLAAIFEKPTIRQLAGAILDSAKFGSEFADSPRVTLNRASGPPFLFAFPPGTGDAAGFIQLAERLPQASFVAFNFIEDERRLARYAELIAEIDPDGPYTLLGYSSGGNLAYHVAGELERIGKSVSDIIMIDSGRKLEPIAFDRDDIETVIDEFIHHESNQPYLGSPVLVEKARRLIRSSYTYFERAVDRHVVNADIHLLRGDASQDVFSDAFGRILSNKLAWQDATSGGFTVTQGVGGHNHMLYAPHVDHNAKLIANILAERCSIKVNP